MDKRRSPGITVRLLCWSECWTQTTGTRSRRAFPTRLPTFATTAVRF